MGLGLRCEGQRLFSSFIITRKHNAISRVVWTKNWFIAHQKMTRERCNGCSHTTPSGVGLFSLQSTPSPARNLYTQIRILIPPKPLCFSIRIFHNTVTLCPLAIKIPTARVINSAQSHQIPSTTSVFVCFCIFWPQNSSFRFQSQLLTGTIPYQFLPNYSPLTCHTPPPNKSYTKSSNFTNPPGWDTFSN